MEENPSPPGAVPADQPSPAPDQPTTAEKRKKPKKSVSSKASKSGKPKATTSAPAGPGSSGTTPARTRKGQFPPGVSGNLAGKPTGSRNRATLVAEQLIDDRAKEIMAKLLKLADAGDPVALKLVVERLLPPRKERHVSFAMPKLTSANDAAKATAAIAAAVSEGIVSPAQAADLARLPDTFSRAIDVAQLAERVHSLEATTTKLLKELEKTNVEAGAPHRKVRKRNKSR